KQKPRRLLDLHALTIIQNNEMAMSKTKK
ncbi:MAG: hypothetical protein ACJAWS_003061, partial [Oleiphilaceae bacterium]